MGFETVSKYGRLLGLGELAGYNLPDEHPDRFRQCRLLTAESRECPALAKAFR